ncbi:MAG: 2Fe-2S iron-sulfur cluster-binding protein [Chloroflexota bacterium]
MSREFTFDFEGRRIPAREGQTVGGALHAAGVRTLSWSARYRRARGLRCGTGACPGCTLVVDGIGGRRACETPATAGAKVRRIRPRFLLLPADELGRLVRSGFQGSRWLRSPGRWNRVEPLLARMAGQGFLPTAPSERLPAATSFRERFVDVLVVGGGHHGCEAAVEAARAGASVLLVERTARVGGRLLDRPGGGSDAAALDAAVREAGVEILCGATALGTFDEGIEGVIAGSELLAVRATRVIRATGSLDREIALPDGDRPGVLLPTAVERLIVREGVRPGRKAVIVTTEDGREQARTVAALLRAAGVVLAAVVAPEDVIAIVGRTRVTGVRMAPGLVRCDLVVIAAGRRPADELDRQADLPVAPHVP